MTDFARLGDEFPKFGQKGFNAAVHSYGEWNKAVKALAARITENTKNAFKDTARTWEQLLGAKSIEQVIEIQSQYAKRSYDNFVAEASKLGEWYVSLVQNASKPVEQSVKNPVEQSIKRKVA